MARESGKYNPILLNEVLPVWATARYKVQRLHSAYVLVEAAAAFPGSNTTASTRNSKIEPPSDPVMEGYLCPECVAP